MSFSDLITISSGKGGVGKTLSVCQIAYFVSYMNKKILILDGDMGMSNVDVLMGVKNRLTLQDVLNEEADLEEALSKGPLNIDLISSGSGLFEMSQLNFIQKEKLKIILEKLKSRYEIILVDSGAGIGDNVCYLNELATKRIIITTPEPHAITDAYATIKVLSQKIGIKDFYFIINMTKTKEEGLQCFNKIKKIAEDFLDIKLNYLGSILLDQDIKRGILHQNLLSQNSIKTNYGQSFYSIAKNLMSYSDTAFSF